MCRCARHSSQTHCSSWWYPMLCPGSGAEQSHMANETLSPHLQLGDFQPQTIKEVLHLLQTLALVKLSRSGSSDRSRKGKTSVVSKRYKCWSTQP